LKNAFVIVTLAGLISACAVAPVPQGQGAAAPGPASAAAPLAELPVAAPVADAADTDAAADSADSADSTAAADAAATGERLPNVALTPDLLYRLTRAEFELRSGNWQAAYVTMLGLAQITRDPRLAHRAADIALGAKQSGEALAAVRLWRELAPESDEASQYYLGFAILSDKLDEAELILAERLRAAPPGPARGLAMFQTQQYLARANDKPAAAALLARLLAPYADVAEAHIVLAQSAYTQNAPERALAEARAALALRPDSEIAVLTAAQVNPDAVAVEAMLTAFVAAYPQAREARTALARVLVERRQYDGARAQFDALLKAQPDNLGTLYALGIMSIQLDEPVPAERYFSRYMAVLDAHPDDDHDGGKVAAILSQLAEQRADYVAALAWLDKIDASDPKALFGARLKRGQLIGKQGQPDAARAYLATIEAADPADQAQLVLADGQVLRDAGRNEAAYAVLADGARRFPASPDLLYDYALMAEKTGHLDVMETALRSVMEQAPDNQHAYNALGYSLAERNVRLAEALALIDKALKMAPGDPFIMDSMGWVQFRLGNFSEAEDHLRRAYALRSDAEIAVHLGEVLWSQGKKADAQKLWREALAKDPKNDTLKATLARLHASL
jgi:tetratricopeptide (TPR) repeat protein